MKATDRRPVGQEATIGVQSRARRIQPYREARDEYARIRVLRKIKPLAAHLRERRFELGMTQEQVAAARGRPIRTSRVLNGDPLLPGLPSCSASPRSSMRNSCSVSNDPSWEKSSGSSPLSWARRVAW